MQKTLTFCLLFLLATHWSSAQNTNPLYAQTSEMANQMVQYDADKGSIMRFYATSNPMEFRGPVSGYNSPERRQRLLGLINANLKQLESIDFDKMNINGKVDYLLFKRNLEDEQYQLQAEQKTTIRLSNICPFRITFIRSSSPVTGAKA
ncbi:hypothetical protein [Haliscomenobacter sp.]|uniref:hypothetical protein n=1 Tax=Haliscomenobacter sp. TaxID=2717303 RepID=UPI003BA9A55A